MARVSVSNADLGGLSSDMARIPPTMVRKGSAVVRKNVRLGKNTTQRIVKSQAGPHGKFAYKRIDSGMTGALEGDYGWTGDADNIVGAGWRHGAGNTDLEKSQDVVGPKFAKDVSDMVDGLFW